MSKKESDHKIDLRKKALETFNRSTGLDLSLEEIAEVVKPEKSEPAERIPEPGPPEPPDNWQEEERMAQENWEQPPILTYEDLFEESDFEVTEKEAVLSHLRHYQTLEAKVRGGTLGVDRETYRKALRSYRARQSQTLKNLKALMDGDSKLDSLLAQSLIQTVCGRDSRAWGKPSSHSSPAGAKILAVVEMGRRSRRRESFQRYRRRKPEELQRAISFLEKLGRVVDEAFADKKPPGRPSSTASRTELVGNLLTVRRCPYLPGGTRRHTAGELFVDPNPFPPEFELPSIAGERMFQEVLCFDSESGKYETETRWGLLSSLILAKVLTKQTTRSAFFRRHDVETLLLAAGICSFASASAGERQTAVDTVTHAINILKKEII